MEIPEPIRAAAGLALTVLDQARQLPSAITGLPVRVAGLAMQTSLRLQQRYASLVVRGDELLTQISGSDETPAWATFDDDVVGVADAVTEEIGVDVSATDVPVTSKETEVALPPLPGTTRTRPPRSTAASTRMGHAPSAFDLVEEVPSASASGPGAAAAVGSAGNGHAAGPGAPATPGAPVPGYDAFTLAQLRARLRTFDAATLNGLLTYERGQRARTPYLTMLENRLNRSRGQG